MSKWEGSVELKEQSVNTSFIPTETEDIHSEEAGLKNIWPFHFLKKIYYYKYSLKWNLACVWLEEQLTDRPTQ